MTVRDTGVLVKVGRGILRNRAFHLFSIFVRPILKIFTYLYNLYNLQRQRLLAFNLNRIAQTDK